MNKYILKNGLIFGGIQIGLVLLIYLINPDLLANFLFGLIIFVLYITLIVVMGRNYKKQNGGVLPFKDAFVILFFIVLIGSALSTLFSILLYTVIDPELPARLLDATIENTIAFMEKMNVPQEQIDKSIDQMKGTSDQFSVGNLIKQFFIGIIVNAILVLIIAAIIKKKPDPFKDNPGILDSNS